MDYKAIVSGYLEDFQSKNLEGLASRVTDDVVMRDEPTIEKGKDRFLENHGLLFRNTIKLTVNVSNIFLDNNTVIVEKMVEADLARNFMMTVFEFTGDKISSIRVYRG